MSIPLRAFKAARLFSPQMLREINPDCGEVDGLSAFPFLQPALSALKNEFPNYIAPAEDVSSGYNVLESGRTMNLIHQLGLRQPN